MADKENTNQGNSEVAEIANESSSDEDIDGGIVQSEFEKKYTNLQKQWLEGSVNEKNLESEEYDKYGEHKYILQYALEDDGTQNNDIVFHPTHSYAYTAYQKDCLLPSMNEEKLKETQQRFESHIDRLEKKILKKITKQQLALNEQAKEKEREKELKNNEETEEVTGWVVPKYSIPIRCDIRAFNFAELARKQKELTGRLFDVIQTDPPWVLAGANPTRGVALGYSQLGDNIISGLPIHLLQENGLIFIWVINAKYRLALSLLKRWGYTMIGDIGWVKQTVNRRIANGHGFYLQHAKETCLIGLKGDINKIEALKDKKGKGVCSDIIYSERRGQSQKPEEVYQYIEHLVPKGFYMEIFARRNNLRNGWFSIGNEL